ncbi:endonuclease [Bacillus pseudomycoides]|nr:endonuclease [Bacillus pseudomycoides]
MEIKNCSICNKEKELSEFYSQHKQSKTRGNYTYYQPYCKECASRKSQTWNVNHRERAREIVAKVENSPEGRIKKRNRNKLYKDQRKQWLQNNPDKVKEYHQKYKDKMFEITNNQWTACKDYFNHSCAYCGMTEIEAQEKFNKGLHKEHATNNGDNDLSNCVTACTGCNSSKHKNDYTEWYISDNTIYDEERMKKIDKWLKEDYKKFIDMAQ